MSAASAVRARRPRAEEASTRRIARLFMVGSACFAAASMPGVTSLSPDAVGVTYFIGSIFFTTAALEQLRTVDRHDRADLFSSLVQLGGTVLFNVNTFNGMSSNLSASRQDLLVWTPDAVGSTCFLIASAIAFVAVFHDPFFAHARRIARLNMVGSIAFGASAAAAFVLPTTGMLLDATIARSMTLFGALCFLLSASILAPPREQPQPVPAT